MSTAIRRTKQRVVITDTMPVPEKMPDGTVYGNYSVTLPNGTKMIPYHYVRTVGDVVDTETGHTRLFLRTLPKRIVRRDEYISYRLSSSPLYVRPSIFDSAAYVDIVAAYPSIYAIAGWRVDYSRGRYLGINDTLIYPYPMSWKTGRSYVVTGARHMQTGRYVRGGKIYTRVYASAFSNPPLVAIVNDVLSAIARVAVYCFGCRYWNVDGGIMPYSAAPYFMKFLQEIGLVGRIKYEGDGVILSSSYWRIGEHETKRYVLDGDSRILQRDAIAMTADEAEWLLKKLLRIKKTR